MKKYELSYADLKEVCSPDVFNFETTAELDDVDLIFGQDRGIAALDFGIAVESKGYNIFMEGPSGVGKTMYAKRAVSESSEKKKTPSDWCYIYNFDDPNEPIAVPMVAGQGKIFKEDMKKFILDVRRSIKRTFNNEDFEKEKTLIKQKYEEKKTKLLDKLNKKSEKDGFHVKTTANGIYMMPVVDGKTIEEEEF